MRDLAPNAISRETLDTLKQGTPNERAAYRAMLLLTSATLDLQAELDRVTAQSEARRALLIRAHAAIEKAELRLRRAP